MSIMAEIYRRLFATKDHTHKKFDDHLANSGIHVGPEDKTKWNDNIDALEQHVGLIDRHVSTDDRTKWTTGSERIGLHADNSDIHVSPTDKKTWSDAATATNLHVTNSTIHLTNAEKLKLAKNYVQSVNGVTPDANGKVSITSVSSATTAGSAKNFVTPTTINFSSAVNSEVTGSFAVSGGETRSVKLTVAKISYTAVCDYPLNASSAANKTYVDDAIAATKTYVGTRLSDSMPDYSKAPIASLAHAFTAPSDGWLFVILYPGDIFRHYYVNGYLVAATGNGHSSNFTNIIPLSKGDVVKTYACGVDYVSSIDVFKTKLPNPVPDGIVACSSRYVFYKCKYSE